MAAAAGTMRVLLRGPSLQPRPASALGAPRQLAATPRRRCAGLRCRAEQQSDREGEGQGAATPPPPAADGQQPAEPLAGQDSPSLQLPRDVIEHMRTTVFSFGERRHALGLPQCHTAVAVEALHAASPDEATTLHVPAMRLSWLASWAGPADTFFVTSVENYQADGVLFQGNLRGDPAAAYAKLTQRLRVRFPRRAGQGRRRRGLASCALHCRWCSCCCSARRAFVRARTLPADPAPLPCCRHTLTGGAGRRLQAVPAAEQG